MDAHSRRSAALTAVQQILAGAKPEELASQTLDFKEENGTVETGGVRRTIPPRHEPAARSPGLDLRRLPSRDAIAAPLEYDDHGQ